MVKNIKEIHPNALALFKSGAFCEAYGKDSYILAYLFGYQIIKKKENDIPKAGFSRSAIPRVLSRLEERKIDYLLIDVRNDYEVDQKSENRNLNEYDEILEKAQIYVKKKRKINEISQKLEEQINSKDFEETIKRIEEILNEKGKV